MMYHWVLHVQSMSLISVASTALIHCITMFVTKAFNFDCPYIIYTITNIMIMVTRAAVNRSIVKVQNGWLVYGPMLIPRQLRFSLYSGAVITEGQV